MIKTYSAKPGELERKWWVIDAEGQVLGRVATHVAKVLRGKHKPGFTPHVDTGDFVIVVNADKVRLTGKKMGDKKYYSYSGYPGGMKEISARLLLEKHPDLVFRRAVKGMLPKNRLSRHLLKKMKVYAGPEHPHQAQNPQPLEVSGKG